MHVIPNPLITSYCKGITTHRRKCEIAVVALVFLITPQLYLNLFYLVVALTLVIILLTLFSLFYLLIFNLVIVRTRSTEFINLQIRLFSLDNYTNSGLINDFSWSRTRALSRIFFPLLIFIIFYFLTI